jgi:hypothetical protein
VSTGLARFARFLPPPEVDVAPPPWHLSRPDVGFDFPADYREFVEPYGGSEAAVGNGLVRPNVYAPCKAPGGWAGLGGFPALAAGEHEVAEMLAEPGLAWVMRSDWLRRGLNVSAGPARRK